MRKPMVRNIPAGAQGMLQIVELRYLKPALQERYIDQMAQAFHQTWGREDVNFATPLKAAAAIRVRAFSGRETILVAHLPGRGVLAGTASIGRGTDYTPDFGPANGVHPKTPIGRDLFVFEGFRSKEGKGSKGLQIGDMPIWQHLVRCRLEWTRAIGQPGLHVFAEGPDLVGLYQRNGARVEKTGLRLEGAEDAITQLSYGPQVLRALRTAAR